MEGDRESIICHECGLPIESQRDLIVTWSFLILRPFHTACYGEALKDERTFRLSNYPMNGPWATLWAVIGGLLAFIFLLLPSVQGIPGPLLSLLLVLFGVLPRLYSWWRYESRL